MAVGVSNGIKFYYESDVAGTWVEVSCTTDLTNDGAATSEVQATCLANVTGYHDFLPGMKDPGTMSATLNVNLEDAGQYRFLQSDLAQNPVPVRRWAFEFTAALVGATDPVVHQNGYISQLGMSAAIDAMLTAPLSVRWSGAPTWAAVLPIS